MLESKLFSLPTLTPKRGVKKPVWILAPWDGGCHLAGSHTLHAYPFFCSVSRALALGGWEEQEGRSPVLGVAVAPVSVLAAAAFVSASV